MTRKLHFKSRWLAASEAECSAELMRLFRWSRPRGLANSPRKAEPGEALSLETETGYELA